MRRHRAPPAPVDPSLLHVCGTAGATACATAIGPPRSPPLSGGRPLRPLLVWDDGTHHVQRALVSGRCPPDDPHGRVRVSAPGGREQRDGWRACRRQGGAQSASTARSEAARVGEDGAPEEAAQTSPRGAETRTDRDRVTVRLAPAV